jgi:hypothetical protein
VAVDCVEAASEAVVAEVTVSAQGACAEVLIEGYEDDELELDGALVAGAEVELGTEIAPAGAEGIDPPKGDGGAAEAVIGAAAPGGAVCAPAAPALRVAVRMAIPVTALRRSQRSGEADVGRLRIIAGDP